MSARHSGNLLNEITFEEHDGSLNAKRVNVVAGTITASSQATVTLYSTPTLFAVVNTSAAGQASVVLDVGTRFIGLTTTVLSSAPTLFAVVNTAAAGQASVRVDGNVTLSDSKGFIGLTTTIIGSSPSVQSFGQFFPSPLSIASGGLGPLLLDQFGRVQTINTGNVTLDVGSLVGIRGNVTLSDPKTYIGLTTTTLGLGDRYIGLVTSTQNGLVTLAPSPNFIGLVTVTNKDRTITGNLTLSDPKGFIGLATVVPSFGSNVTIFTQIVSASGNTTVFVAPASNRFFLTSLQIGSLGRSEVEIRSGATTIIPFTALATTGGYIHDWALPGFPSRAQADAFVVNLNGAATISIMASTYFQP